MKQIRSYVAVLCAWQMMLAPVFGQQQSGQQSAGQETKQESPRGPQLDTERPHWYSSMTRPYESKYVPPVSVSNSTRIDSLMRAGKLYLSLQDSIALALENNLDVEIERYGFSLADADLLRAKSGAAIQGIQTNVLPGVPAGGQQLLGSVSSGLAAGGAASPLGAGQSFDPVIISNVNFGHTTAPQSNTITSGTPALVTENTTANFGVSQSFVTGGTATLSFNNTDALQNSFRSSVNPVTNSFLDLTYTQPLLQGFGIALNNRTIRIAKNNLRAADLVFRQQLTNTVSNVVSLYWNLVAAVSAVEVRKQAVSVSQKLYDDNKKQVEIGTLAPIEIVRAEAQLAQNEQALVAAQATVSQLETVLKSAISRNGLASPTLTDATIIATDPIRIPEVEAIQPVQDLVSKALDDRPDLAQSRIQINNAEIALTGTRSALLPTLNLVGDVRNTALAGAQNTVVGPVSSVTGTVQNPPIADPFFVGGYGTVLSQIFSRNFPTYTLGFSLNIPLKNRAAQANMVTASLNLRQNQLQIQRLINQIRVDVQNALIALQNARAQYQAAVKQRILQEQTLDADQKKLALGATTVYQVIQDQRDLTTAGFAEVSAQAAYMTARVQLDVATGEVLQANRVEFDEAKKGSVARPPSTVPAVEPNRGR
jgi:outer membrane protein